MREMQMKLSQIAMIPILIGIDGNQIQSTVESIERTVESVAVETSETTTNTQIGTISETFSSSASTEIISNISNSNVILDASSHAANEVSIFESESCDIPDELCQTDGISCEEVVFSPPPSPERDTEPESELKNEQIQKMREMEKSWPWKDEEKKVYK